eukprot:jgi/Psemu1/15841/gm1.15841_g
MVKWLELSLQPIIPCFTSGHQNQMPATFQKELPMNISVLLPKQRGVSPQDEMVLNSVMKDHPKLKPKAMAGEVLKTLVQDDSPSVLSPELRSQLGKKMKNKIKGARSNDVKDV